MSERIYQTRVMSPVRKSRMKDHGETDTDELSMSIWECDSGLVLAIGTYIGESGNGEEVYRRIPLELFKAALAEAESRIGKSFDEITNEQDFPALAAIDRWQSEDDS